MTTEIMFYGICNLVLIHYFADFVFQSNWMAENKSKLDSMALSIHVLVYGLTLMLFLPWVLAYVPGGHVNFDNFILVNIVIHWLVDFVTSRLNKKFWENKHYRKFFLTLGFDQLIHILTLIGTFYIFYAR